jgi:hypothetical protein
MYAKVLDSSATATRLSQCALMLVYLF